MHYMDMRKENYSTYGFPLYNTMVPRFRLLT